MVLYKVLQYFILQNNIEFTQICAISKLDLFTELFGIKNAIVKRTSTFYCAINKISRTIPKIKATKQTKQIKYVDFKINIKYEVKTAW